MKFFGLKTCDTCRKALKELATAGQSPDVIDVRKDGLSPSDVSQIVAQFGATAVNRASTTWRGLSDEEKEQAPDALLEAHPTLMKRPVVTDGERWTIGWKADAKAVWLGET